MKDFLKRTYERSSGYLNSEVLFENLPNHRKMCFIIKINVITYEILNTSVYTKFQIILIIPLKAENEKVN